MENTMKMYVTADEAAQILGVSRGYAYKIIRGLNNELKEKGLILKKGTKEIIDYLNKKRNTQKGRREMLDLLKEHIASLNYGWVSFVFEVLIVIFAIIAISIILVRHVRSKHIFISYLVTLILLLISIIVGTTIGI